MALADWLIVAILGFLSLVVGLTFTRRAGRQGARFIKLNHFHEKAVFYGWHWVFR